MELRDDVRGSIPVNNRKLEITISPMETYTHTRVNCLGYFYFTRVYAILHREREGEDKETERERVSNTHARMKQKWTFFCLMIEQHSVSGEPPIPQHTTSGNS